VANTWITSNSGQIARVALATLAEDVVLGQTVHRDFDNEFGGGSGDTINIRVPASLAARTYSAANRYTTPITYDDLTEATVPLVLDSILYSAVRLPDEEVDLDIANFTAQVTGPQAEAVAQGLEDAIAAEMNGVAATAGLQFPLSPTDGQMLDEFADARKALRDNNVPTNNLFAAVSTDVATKIIKDSEFRRVDASGSEGALREAIIGKIHGFTVVESNKLTAGSAVFYHRDAFALATRAPQVPRGAGAGSSVSAYGYSMTWTADYDPNYLADRSVVRALAGSAVLDADRVVKADTSAT
jgi:hypothetical protein